MGKAKKAWGGRFAGPTERRVEEYTASLPFDWRLYPYDIQGSIAYARALTKAGVLPTRRAATVSASPSAKMRSFTKSSTNRFLWESEKPSRRHSS